MNDIWYLVFQYLTDHKDVFSVSSVDWNFRNLIQAKLYNFQWYKYHILMMSFGLAPKMGHFDQLLSYVSTKMGIFFQLIEREEKIFLLMTDYTGYRKEIEIPLKFLTMNFARSCFFVEFADSITPFLFHTSGRYCIELNLENQTIKNGQLIANNYYCYNISTIASPSTIAHLSAFNKSAYNHELISLKSLTFHFDGLIIRANLFVKIFPSKENFIKVVACETNSSDERQCHYHKIPLKNHRIFVVQFGTTINFICFIILKGTIANCSIICKKKTLPYTWYQYYLEYSSIKKTLTLIKFASNKMTIIDEFDFDDDNIGCH